MGKKFAVYKIASVEAIQINSDEEAMEVRSWLSQFLGHEDAQTADLTTLIDSGVYFMRDEGFDTVYITLKEDFPKLFKIVEEEYIPTLEENGLFVETEKEKS